MHKLAVLGNPIVHSLSPQIHQQFAAQFSISLDYQKILVPLDQFVQTAEHFLITGGLGFNVTVPFKATAFQWLLSHHTERAHAAGAVNTVFRQADQWVGDNTDGIGFIRDCQKKHIALTDQTIVIMGSGGAAQGIVSALLAEHPSKIIILCRDKIKTAQLFSKQIIIATYAESPHWLPEANLLIDATPDKNILKETLAKQSMVAKNLVVYDLKYKLIEQTTAVAWASTQGLTAYDGLGMLLEQAAESFYQWFQLRPDIEKLVVPQE